MLNRLQYISQGETVEAQRRNIQGALQAGCRWIQFRFKNSTKEEFTALAKELKDLCATADATFIINDHVDVAREIDADGVHVGLDDMPIAQVKELLGESKIIGGTANTLAHVVQRYNEGCTYVGLGPYRFTTTKEKLSPTLGLDGYKQVINSLKTQKIDIPIIAIGGLEVSDIAPLRDAGIYGVAVSGIVTHAENKKNVVQQLNNAL